MNGLTAFLSVDPCNKNVICISLYDLFQMQIKALKNRGQDDDDFNYDFTVAVIFAVGELDSWREQENLKPYDYFNSLRRYWDQHGKLPQFMQIVDDPEDDEDTLSEFLEMGIGYVIAEAQDGESLLDDKYRWPGDFYISPFF